MQKINLLPHQKRLIDATEGYNRVAYYVDMGLGKTFIGSEKIKLLNSKISLIICQKSKVSDWVEHMSKFYECEIINCTKLKKSETPNILTHSNIVLVMNYDLVFRRTWINNLSDFTLLLDESSLIKNENSKKTKAILNLNYKNVILLSGTPVGGKYEELWSQLHLLGWKISKRMYMNNYVDYTIENVGGFPLMRINGYKNVDRLKSKLRTYGAVFMKTEEVIDLPEQTFTTIRVAKEKELKKYEKDKLVTVDGETLAGDTSLVAMYHTRLLSGVYSNNKLNALRDVIESTNDRLIIFYNFNSELAKMLALTDKPVSLINGKIKDLSAYENNDNSITFVQYQAGAMGLNLQKANKIIYYTPPLSSEVYEQSKKRIHRVGQNKPCFYYNLVVKNSVEEKIYKVLSERKDYTDELFKEEFSC